MNMPADIEAEQAVIASCLVDPHAYPEVAFLAVTDFWDERNSVLFDAIGVLNERGEYVNQITVASELARRGQIAAVGGQTYIASLIRACPTSMGAAWYAQTVARAAKKRKLVTLAKALESMALDPEVDPETVAAKGLDQLVRAEVAIGRELTVSLDTVLRETVWQSIVERMDDPQRALGLRTGITTLDALTGGVRRGQLITCISDTGTGKSFLMGTVARQVAIEGGRVLVFSTEMGRAESVERQVWSASAVNPANYQHAPKFPTGVQARVISAMDEMMGEWGKRIWINDLASPPLGVISAETKRLHTRSDLSLLVVDGVQRVTTPGESRVVEMERVMQGMKGVAQNIGLPVIVTVHPNRAGQERGQLTYRDGKFGNSIEQESDVIWVLNMVDDSGNVLDRPGAMDYRASRGYQRVRLSVEKNRGGSEGFEFLRFDVGHGGRWEADE